MCRDNRVPILNCDTLHRPMEKFDIDLIRNESNVEAPRRGPRIEVPLLSKNFADTVQLDQGAYPAVQEDVDPTPSSSSHLASRPPARLDLFHYLHL